MLNPFIWSAKRTSLVGIHWTLSIAKTWNLLVEKESLNICAVYERAWNVVSFEIYRKCVEEMYYGSFHGIGLETNKAAHSHSIIHNSLNANNNFKGLMMYIMRNIFILFLRASSFLLSFVLPTSFFVCVSSDDHECETHFTSLKTIKKCHFACHTFVISFVRRQNMPERKCRVEDGGGKGGGDGRGRGSQKTTAAVSLMAAAEE